MAERERRDKAWQACRNWITDFDGSVTQAELSGAGVAGILEGIAALEAGAANLRILPIWREEEKNPPVGLPVPGLVERLVESEILSLTVNYTFLPQESPVEMHMALFIESPGRAGISVSWWADQAFPEGEDPPTRFSLLFEHLCNLQEAFGASRLYLSPEAPDRPGDPGSLWLEV